MIFRLARTRPGVVDLGESLAEVGDRAGGSHDVGAGLDLDGLAAAGGLDELADGPAGLVLDEAADGQGGEDDGQVGFDGVALAASPWSRSDGPARCWHNSTASAVNSGVNERRRRGFFPMLSMIGHPSGPNP